MDEDIPAPVMLGRKKSHKQRRQKKLVGTVEENRELPPSLLEEEWGDVPENVGQLQSLDSTLQEVFT